MAQPVGIEPTTSGLTVQRSASELRLNNVLEKHPRQGLSNFSTPSGSGIHLSVEANWNTLRKFFRESRAWTSYLLLISLTVLYLYVNRLEITCQQLLRNFLFQLETYVAENLIDILFLFRSINSFFTDWYQFSNFI